MQQHQFRPPKGARKDRKIIGRGDGSGHGSYSGKGVKGQKARTGGNIRPGFDGQLPLIQALPKLRGFTNIFRINYALVNLDSLAGLPSNSDVTPESLLKAGLIDDLKRPVKILGRGELSVPLAFEAHRFSASARAKIEAAGGSVKELS